MSITFGVHFMTTGLDLSKSDVGMIELQTE